MTITTLERERNKTANPTPTPGPLGAHPVGTGLGAAAGGAAAGALAGTVAGPVGTVDRRGGRRRRGRYGWQQDCQGNRPHRRGSILARELFESALRHPRGNL